MAIRIVLIQHYLALYKNGVGFLWNIKYIFQNCSLQLISQKTLQRVKLLLTIEDTGRPGGAGMAPRPCNFRNSLFTAKKAGPQIACHHGEKDEPERLHTLGPERPQAADLKKSRQSGVFMPPPPDPSMASAVFGPGPLGRSALLTLLRGQGGPGAL